MNHTQATHPIMQAAEREEDLPHEQQHHLHEPQSMLSTIDPITGKPPTIWKASLHSRTAI